MQKIDKMNATDKIFYVIGWILISGLLLIALLQNIGVLTLTDLGWPCTFRSLTGYYCPGCGGTHAVCSVAGGHFLSSLKEHAFVVYTAAGFTIYLFWNTVASLSNRRGKHTLPILHFHTFYIYIGIAILLVQWLIKNILYMTL